MMFAVYEKFIMFLCDLLEMEVPTVVFAERDEKEKIAALDIKGEIIKYEIDETVKGRYLPETNTLFINLFLHKDNDEYISIVHEIRHAYQYNEMRTDEPAEDDDLIKEWKDNFDNYLSAHQSGYINQPVEIDANAFTYYIFESIFKKPIQIYDKELNRDLFLNRIHQIGNDYTDKMIGDSIMYTEAFSAIQGIFNIINSK